MIIMRLEEDKRAAREAYKNNYKYRYRRTSPRSKSVSNWWSILFKIVTVKAVLVPQCRIPVSYTARCKTVGQWRLLPQLDGSLAPLSIRGRGPKKLWGQSCLDPRIAVPQTSFEQSQHRKPPFTRCGDSTKPTNSSSGKMAEVNQDYDVKSQKRDRSEFEGEGKSGLPSTSACLDRR